MPKPLKKLPLSFFQQDAATVARDLIGKIITRRLGAAQFQARITETEAYVGPHDLACHAAKGRTARTEVMFGPGGYAYVYLIYGMHDMLNIVTGTVGDAQAVLLRAAEPLHGWSASLTGPGKLAKALGVTRAHNGLSLTSPELFLLHDPAYHPDILITPRIGIGYAKEWINAPLRFIDTKSPAISKPPRHVTAHH